jgi:hypothetical protein
MEAIDIEELNFDEYNREVYFDKNPLQDRQDKEVSYTLAFDAQKRYKSEIDKFVAQYKSGLARNEIDEENLGRIKKRKY